jgi:hypothetical protein
MWRVDTATNATTAGAPKINRSVGLGVLGLGQPENDLGKAIQPSQGPLYPTFVDPPGQSKQCLPEGETYNLE